MEPDVLDVERKVTLFLDLNLFLLFIKKTLIFYPNKILKTTACCSEVNRIIEQIAYGL